jgi:LmbE family N-acetylglucosaminyl deacetylase
MGNEQLRLMVIGAHPDDCDIAAGGTAALYRRAGHEVCFVSVTNGESGHQTDYGPQLAAVRQAEAEAAGRVVGLDYRVLSNRDGWLLPTLEVRFAIIRLIREFAPDLLLTHRPNDYHPDHRYVSQLVQDAAYLLTVPAVAPEAPALRRDPVIAYVADNFQKPYPFSPTVVVDVEPVVDKVVDMLACHASQFYDWLPYNKHYDEKLPADPQDRWAWLERQYRKRLAPRADKYRELLVQTYGEDRGRAVTLVEAFEPCEYGSPLDEQARRRLFPFLPR